MSHLSHFFSRIESSCIAKSFYCWGCVEKGINKSTDNIMVSGRRHCNVAVDTPADPVPQYYSDQISVYHQRDIDAILEDYSYFETFTGKDPTCRDSQPSNYVNQTAKCYKNLRNQDSYLLVWSKDINYAYLEHINEESLEKFQLATIICSSSYEPEHKATNKNNIEKKQGMPECEKHLTLVTKDRINEMTDDYDEYESFVGLDPLNRLALDSKTNRITKTAKCYRHKNQKSKYILMWNVDDDHCLPEELSEDELESLQSANILDLQIDSDSAMDFVSKLDIGSLNEVNETVDVMKSENEDTFDYIRGKI